MSARDNLKVEAVADLVRQFESVYREHMQHLPIVNSHLSVEAVGFQDFGGHQLGVLITPWFMNLVLLPGSDEWARNAQGDTVITDFPSGPIEFSICHDPKLGTYLTAVLFRTVQDIGDQPMAREFASAVMNDLFLPSGGERRLSRRDLLTGLRSR